jgi:hypothetical protein
MWESRSGCRSAAFSSAVGSLGCGRSILPLRRTYVSESKSRVLQLTVLHRIVQEAVLAKHLILGCGGKRISWDIFHAAASLCFLEGRSDRRAAITDERTQKNILQLGKLRQNRTSVGFVPSDDMFTLLQLFHQKNVTNPRDRLFALLSMATDGTETRLLPNYTATEEKVILEYATVFVEKGRALDLLYQARLAWLRDKLPSWLPKLTAAEYPSTLRAWGAGYKAGGPRANDFVKDVRNVELNDTVLTLEGYRVDWIARLGDHASNTGNVLLYLDDIFDAINEIYPPQEHDAARCRVPLGDPRVTPQGDWDPKHGPAGAYQALREYMTRYPADTWKSLSKTEMARAGNALTDTGHLLRSMAPFMEAALEFAEVFRPASAIVCETGGSRVGIVPMTAAIHDQVVVFRGAEVPYLIRESEARDGTFLAVGECFVDGIMHGELFDGRGSGRTAVRLQRFKLR